MATTKPRAIVRIGVDTTEADAGLKNLNQGFAAWAASIGEKISAVGSGLRKVILTLSLVATGVLVLGGALRGLAIVSKATAFATGLLGVSFAGVTAALGRAGAALGGWATRVGGLRGILKGAVGGLGSLATAFTSVGLGIRLTMFSAVALTTAFSALMAVIGVAVTGVLLAGGIAFLALTASVGGVVSAFSAGVPKAMEFDRALRGITTIASEAAFPLERLNSISYEIANTYGGKVTDNARTLYEIISAGVTDATSATETLYAAQKLAIGGMASLSASASGLTGVMNAYAAQGVTATRVSDAMFTAAADGATTIEQLAESLGMVAPIAASVGLSVEEMSSAVAVLTANGIKTSTAAEYLRSALTNIIKPSDQARAVAKELGVEFNASALASQGLATFLQKVVVESGATKDQLGRLFGDVGGLTAVLALAAGNGEKLSASLNRMAVNAGASDIAFEKMSDTLAFQADRWDAVKDASLTAFGQWGTDSEKMRRALSAITDALNEVTTWLRQDENKEAFNEVFGTALRVVAETGLAIINVIEILETMGRVLRVVLSPVTSVISPVIDGIRELNIRLAEDQPDSPLLRRLSDLAVRLRDVADGVERVDYSKLMSDPDAMSRDDVYQSVPRDAPGVGKDKGDGKKLTDAERKRRELAALQDQMGLEGPLSDPAVLQEKLTQDELLRLRNERIAAEKSFGEQYAAAIQERGRQAEEQERATNRAAVDAHNEGIQNLADYGRGIQEQLQGLQDLFSGDFTAGAVTALLSFTSIVSGALSTMFSEIANSIASLDGTGVLAAVGNFFGNILTQMGQFAMSLGVLLAVLGGLATFIPALAIFAPAAAYAPILIGAGVAAMAAGAALKAGITSATSSSSAGGGGGSSVRAPSGATGDRKVRASTFNDGASLGGQSGIPRGGVSSRSEPVTYVNETHVHLGRGMVVASSSAQFGRELEGHLGASARLRGARDPWGRG